jgi:rubredoxin
MAEVKCRGCAERYIETTNKFNPEIILDATMVKLIDKYGPGGYNWTFVPPDPWHIGDSISCPQCDTPYPGVDGKINDLIDFEELESGLAAAARKRELEEDPNAYILEQNPEFTPPPDTPVEVQNFTKEAWVCPECGVFFDTKQKMKAHIQGKHKNFIGVAKNG